jgi:hypothetical protein
LRHLALNTCQNLFRFRKRAGAGGSNSGLHKFLAMLKKHRVGACRSLSIMMKLTTACAATGRLGWPSRIKWSNSRIRQSADIYSFCPVIANCLQRKQKRVLVHTQFFTKTRYPLIRAGHAWRPRSAGARIV